MRLRMLFYFFAIVLSLSSYSQTVTLVPQPVSLQLGKGTFAITPKTVIAARDEEDKKAATIFNTYVHEYYGFELPIAASTKGGIQLTTKKFIKAPDRDAYQLTVSSAGIRIVGDTYAGTFYGLQTLIQLLPPQKTNFFKIPYLTVNDYPRFGYRGLMLDAGRHFFPVSFVKKYIDYIAIHKMNYFHWHLTDDQGWRIEIKKYPGLTQKGGFRNGSIVGRYPGTGNDDIHYGGFYTQDDVKEVVQYAQDRHVTVIPEIEMPGHSSAAISAYPWLSCFPNQPTKTKGAVSQVSQQKGGKIVQETWGVFDDVYCAGKDSTFQFLQDVLDEVLPLFPSPYIHVGGDESPKTNWKICPNCQKRISDEHLKDEHALQSYFIQRMEKYVNSKGRTIIGWDEILEGGLAPNAVVMSWRGEAGGIEAAKQKHKVIMTPTTYVYFDYTQSTNEDSVTIGGYIPVEKVYNYEPIPAELQASEAPYVMGAQANLWTEYITNPRKVEYMIFPRLDALSEVLWTPKEKKSWPAFEKKLPRLFQRYRFWNIGYSRAYYDLNATLEPAPANNGVQLRLNTKDKAGRLTYGISGQHLQKKYSVPVTITQPGEVLALYTAADGVSDTVSFQLQFNKATGKKIELKDFPSKKYMGDGAFTLVNGVINTKGLSKGREFIAYEGGDLEATIDLGTSQSFSSVVLHTLQQEGSWIYAPSAVAVSTSDDGTNFKEIGQSRTFEAGAGSNGNMTVSAPATARFVKVQVRNYGVIPDDKAGAGNRAWLFADEIEIN